VCFPFVIHLFIYTTTVYTQSALKVVKTSFFVFFKENQFQTPQYSPLIRKEFFITVKKTVSLKPLKTVFKADNRDKKNFFKTTLELKTKRLKNHLKPNFVRCAGQVVFLFVFHLFIQ